MENKKNCHCELVLVLLIAVLGGLGVLWLTNSQMQKMAQPNVPVIQSPTISAQQEEVKGTETKPPLEELTTGWATYTNSRYGYSFRYPPHCVVGDWPQACQNQTEDQRSDQCSCRLDFSNEDDVVIESYPGREGQLTVARLEVIHHQTQFYNPPSGSNVVVWLQQTSGDPRIPDVTNYLVGDIPAVKIDTPPSSLEYAKENIYLIWQDKLFNISLSNQYQDLYDTIVSTFRF